MKCLQVFTMILLNIERKMAGRSKNFYLLLFECHWDQEINKNHYSILAVSCPVLVKSLCLIKDSISLTHSHIHTVNVKVLFNIVVFDVTHDQAHALHSCCGVKSPALHVNLVRYTCRLCSYKVATIVATKYFCF